MDEWITRLFPHGISTYLVGGLLVGLGTSLIFVFTGIRAGASGVLTSAFSYVTSRSSFGLLKGERAWRTLLTLGLIAGAALYTLAIGEPFRTEIPLLNLAAGGFLVGMGTRAARGCTSGHGICGLSSLSGPSLVHVCTFMGIAMLTAYVVGRLT